MSDYYLLRKTVSLQYNNYKLQVHKYKKKASAQIIYHSKSGCSKCDTLKQYRNKQKFVNQLTLDGPTPTNISRNSEPETVINGTLASPAVALASNVFPVPGGPVKQFQTLFEIKLAISNY